MTLRDKKYARKLATLCSPKKIPNMVFSSSSSGGLFRGLRLNVYNLAVFPLRVLFFRGPRLWGYGFGGGSSPENMCQSFTNVRSEFWSSSDTTQTECFEILERRFHAFVVGAVALSALAVAIQTVYLSVNRYFLLKPLNEVNRNLEKVIRHLQCHTALQNSGQRDKLQKKETQK